MNSLAEVLLDLRNKGFSDLGIIKLVIENLDNMNKDSELAITSIVDWSGMNVDIPDSCMCDFEELLDIAVIIAGMKYLVSNNFTEMDSEVLSRYSINKFKSKGIPNIISKSFCSLMIYKKSGVKDKYKEFSIKFLDFIKDSTNRYRYSFLTYCFLSKTHPSTVLKGLLLSNNLDN